MEDIFLPVIESAVVLASHYTKECGRDCVTGTDMIYGLMYSARHVTGKQLGSLYPEIYEEDEEDEEEEEEDEPEAHFTRYMGSEDICVKMNECYDTWNDWIPETPAEQAFKNAVNKACEQYETMLPYTVRN